MTAFLAPALPVRRTQRDHAWGARACVHRRPRRSDYLTRGTEPRAYVEPEELVIVGVSHGAAASAARVRETILAERPDAVVVELCRSRAGLLAPPGAARRVPATGPLLALLRAAGRRAKPPEGDPAAEFRAAADAARAVGATVVLGDRPVARTLSRAWEALAPRERVALIFAAARSLLLGGTRVEDAVPDPRLREVLETGDGDIGVVDAYVRLFSRKFPALMGPLVAERDLYLAWCLKRSQAVKGTRKVVGVLGHAHVKGVLAALDEDDQFRREDKLPPLRFRALV